MAQKATCNMEHGAAGGVLTIMIFCGIVFGGEANPLAGSKTIRGKQVFWDHSYDVSTLVARLICNSQS